METPPVTEFEEKSNLTMLQQELHRKMKCFAGKNKVYLQSIIGDDGKKSRPRLAIKCHLRAEFKMGRHVYYEYIRDVCCGDPAQCFAFRKFLQNNPQSALALKYAGKVSA